MTPIAARRSPNGSLSPVGICPTPNSPASASSLSASATAWATGPSGSAVAGEAGPVVLRDCVRDVAGLAVVLRVIAAHRALQLRKLADHVGHEVRLGEQRSALGVNRIGTDRGGERARQASATGRHDRSGARACRASPDRRRSRASAAAIPASSSDPGRRRTSHPRAARAARARCRRRSPADRRSRCCSRRGSAHASGPRRSVSAKYFWFCCIVRIRHSCGTARNAGSNVPARTTGHSTREVTSSSSASGAITRSPCAAFASPASIAARRAANDGITFPSASTVGAHAPAFAIVIPVRDMKRCPSVMRPASSPSADTGTTSPPCSASKRCAGRTNAMSL